MAKASSSSKSSGSSKTSSSSSVKKSTPPPAKPKNVDKVEFNKPKPQADAGVYHKLRMIAAATGRDPEPKKPSKAELERIERLKAIEEAKSALPVVIDQANKAFQELHDAYQKFQTTLDEVEDLKKNPPTDDLSASQKVGALVAGVGTVKKALDVLEVVGAGAGAVAIGGFALGMGVTLALEKLYNNFDNWYDKADLESELRNNSIALDIATANFNHKTQKLYELIEEAGGKIEGVEIQFPADLRTIVKDFKIPAT